jgi:PAS domain S-box-containing protein
MTDRESFSSPSFTSSPSSPSSPSADDGPPSDRGVDPTWFERAVEAAGHAIFITNVDGRIVYVNPAFEVITGYAVADAVGRTPTLLNSGHHPDDYFRRLWETILGGDVWQDEIVNERADGDRYVAEQTIAPVAGADGTITQFVAIQTDITERREHELALERQQDLSTRTEETANVGGWELNVETDELRWTVGTRRIHEVPPDYDPSLEEAIEFYHPADRDTIRQFVDRALEWEHPYDVEARLVTDEGNTRIVRTTGERVADDPALLRGTINDITDRKSRQQQLMVFNRVLRHNLRNDLNVVLGHARRLQASLVDVDADAPARLDHARRDVDAIVSAAEELIDVSERARTFDRVYSRIDDVEPVEIGSLCTSVVESYRDSFPEATLRVEGVDPTVLVNPEAIRVVVEELVENALEHSAESRPTVVVGVRETTDGGIRLGVADRGVGIPEIERRVIESGEETATEHGSGLGLWMVKWLVTSMGGTLTIDDNDPRGTVVAIEFPASRWWFPDE